MIGALEERRVIQADITLTNPGTLDTLVDWKWVRFDIIKVDKIESNGTYVFSDTSKAFRDQTIRVRPMGDGTSRRPLMEHLEHSRMELRTNDHSTITALQTVGSAGLYMVVFAILSPHEGDQRAESSIVMADGAAYVVVP